MKIIKKIAAVILCMICLTQNVYGAGSADEAKKMAISAYEGEKNLANTSESLLSLGDDFPAGTSICDWTALAVSLLGAEKDTSAYIAAMNSYISENFSLTQSGQKPKATEWHRTALTVRALGGDPTACGTDGTTNLIAGGTYDYAGDSLGEQGLNGWIFALITLDSGNYEIPEGKSLTREEIIKTIIEAQEEDGGFGLTEGSSDTDITAMAIQALAPYAENEAKDAVDKALNYLSSKMTDQCLFVYTDEPTSESSSQIIIALCALGIDPAEDQRFAKGDTNILTALVENYQCEDGSYGHLTGDTRGDCMATEQALLAMTALWRMRNGGIRLYDLTNVEAGQTQQSSSIPIVPIAVAVVIIAAGVICIIVVKKKRENKA